MLFNSKSSERLLFIDSHMHLDKLQNASKRRGLCEIMKHGPMPSELVELKFAVVVLREKFYAKEVLWHKVLVFHCRDEHLSTEASDLCLEILKEEVPSFDKDMVATVILMIGMKCSDGQLSSDIQNLALQDYCYDKTLQLLLETDSPYLLPPEHNRCEYNTPYGIVNVAIRIADLRYQNLKEILDITTTNAMELYKLK